MLKIQDVQAEAGKIVYGRLMVDSVQIPLMLAAGQTDGPVVVFHCASTAPSTAARRLCRGCCGTWTCRSCAGRWWRCRWWTCRPS